MEWILKQIAQDIDPRVIIAQLMPGAVVVRLHLSIKSKLKLISCKDTIENFFSMNSKVLVIPEIEIIKVIAKWKSD